MILILSGLPASGKTTYAMSWLAEAPHERVRINYDELRVELYGADWKFNRAEEEVMKKIAHAKAHKALEAGMDVVIDNTNLTDRARRPWVELGNLFKVPVEQQEIDTPVHECVERDKKREARVGRAVIERMALFHGFIDWNDGYGPASFVVVDMDGTLADSSGRAEKYLTSTPKDWAGFFTGVDNDAPIMPIVDLVELLSIYFSILVVSGRPIDQCGKPTEDWLDKHLPAGGVVRHLFMRQGGDHRPDVEVKAEILALLPKDRIAYVIDDRPSVLRMWQSHGLTTLAVGDLKEF